MSYGITDLKRAFLIKTKTIIWSILLDQQQRHNNYLSPKRLRCWLIFLKLALNIAIHFSQIFQLLYCKTPLKLGTTHFILWSRYYLQSCTMPFVHWKCDFYQVGDAIKNHFIYWARQGRRKGPQLVIIPRLLSEGWLIIPNSQKMLVFFAFVSLAFVLSTSEGNTLKTFLTKVEKLNLLRWKKFFDFRSCI